MANKFRKKMQKRRMSGTYKFERYAQLPHSVFGSKEMRYLQRKYPLAVVLLIQLLSQHNGTNNGDLAVALVRDRWRSKTTLYRCVSQLLQLGWIIQTRYGQWGHKNKPALYALSWLPIDECDDKLELAVGTTTPPDTWREFNGMSVGDDTVDEPEDIYKEVHLVDQGLEASSPPRGLESSPPSGPALVHEVDKRIFTDQERRMIESCQKLPKRLKVPSWIKRERDRDGNTIALRFDWPASTLAAA